MQKNKNKKKNLRVYSFEFKKCGSRKVPCTEGTASHNELVQPSKLGNGSKMSGIFTFYGQVLRKLLFNTLFMRKKEGKRNSKTPTYSVRVRASLSSTYQLITFKK